MELSLQALGAPVDPLKVIVLVPCDAPKPLPEAVTRVPEVPDVGESEEISGGWAIVNGTELLGTPFTVMTMLPEVAPAGTFTPMLVLLQLVGMAVVPLKLMVLVPCVGPKLLPLIVMAVPTRPAEGRTLLIAGGVDTVNGTPVLGTPPTFTTTLPVVAPAGTGTTMVLLLQLVGVAAMPLRLIVLLACEAPKFTPLIVTCVPTGPKAGDRLDIDGPMMRFTPLLLGRLVPATINTGPVVDWNGTMATMDVLLQLTGVAKAAPMPLTELAIWRELCPWIGPKFVPVTVTKSPILAMLGDTLEICGASAVKTNGLLDTFATVT
jgi:hypothetical protein